MISLRIAANLKEGDPVVESIGFDIIWDSGLGLNFVNADRLFEGFDVCNVGLLQGEDGHLVVGLMNTGGGIEAVQLDGKELLGINFEFENE